MNKIFLILLSINLASCGPRDVGSIPDVRDSRDQTERPPVRSDLTVDSPDQMPAVDRSQIPADEDRWQSPEARRHHDEVMNQLWGTPLGQMYLAYLTDDVEAKIVPGRARQIIDRIYEQGEHVGKRLQLVQSLTFDLYGREKMSEDIVKRLVLFDRLAHAKETGNQENNSDKTINLMIVAALASVPFGSPVVREEFGNLWSHSTRLCFWRQCNRRAIQWGRLLRPREVFKDYQPSDVVGTFLAVGGGASMMFSLGLEKLPGWRKSVSKDEQMLNGLEDLLTEAEF